MTRFRDDTRNALPVVERNDGGLATCGMRLMVIFATKRKFQFARGCRCWSGINNSRQRRRIVWKDIIWFRGNDCARNGRRRSC